jgi:hypothetical protein
MSQDIFKVPSEKSFKSITNLPKNDRNVEPKNNDDKNLDESYNFVQHY